MPRISEFYGIAVSMYYDDHAPPHVHASYGGQRASIAINPIRRLRGTLTPRALALVADWIALHQGELQENWERVQRHEAPRPIAPLD